ncbi:MAG: hypothetical protein RSC82_06900 [Oscillospiraceae bacterium]
MSNLELCVDEYKLIQTTSEKYFDYMYRTLNLYLLFLSAVLVFGLSQDSQLVFSAIFCYLIPVFSMIFGLLFCYNSCALAKIGYIGINHLFANIFLSILPFLFYLIYLVFMLFIISSILQNVRWTSQELREIEEEIEAGDCSWPWSQHFLAAKSTQDKKKSNRQT